MALFLGLDSSTQSLKGVLIDPATGELVHGEAVNFGKELPEFKCPNGFLENEDPLVKTSNPLLWAAALNLLLSKFAKAKAPLSQVAGIGGSGQQHGTVYLNEAWAKGLSSLDPNRDLASQIKPLLSRLDAPIWMDSSTGEDCARLDALFGKRLQTDTGSPATERFAGPQISKFARLQPEAWGKTSRVHLVSSFMASLFCGADAPVDCGDGAGMNLLNLKTLDWDREIVEATAPGLLAKLPRVAAKNCVAGNLHPYFAKYGLRPGIQIAPFTGDNPASLVGTGAFKPGVAVVSLGTSDTLFAALDKMLVDPEGCGSVFGNPAGGFMSLVCFKNGSLAREKFRDMFGLDWKGFDEAALSSAPGNGGALAIPAFVPEITPVVLKPGLRLKGDKLFESGKAPAPVMLRAILESQALSLRKHSSWMGRKLSTLRVTGGGSKSKALKRIFADVLQARLESISVPDSAALGAAMTAANAAGGFAWDDLAAKFCKAEDFLEPDLKLAGLYAKMSEDYAIFEKEVLA